MPKQGRKKTKEGSKNNFFFKIKWSESYVSLLLGLVVIVAVAALGIIFVKSQRTTETSSTQLNPSIQIQEEKNANKDSNQKTYTIKQGDNLWTISENFYKSGYNWVDIAKVNNLENPGMIFARNKLVIPKVEPKIITVITSEKQEIGKSIAGNFYTIEKGDNLWDIAVRAYGDGFSWTRIAKANSLDNPDLIFSGNVLKIPR
ncbi:MAG: hypothetical protein A3B44_01425 [Candidatus Levybacteria bacterium RIFCSPLOWO2_01_FULL_38_21]|nr:MAG: hypothetical protein A3B44_01425 [Candidatus Levybacteria bacterium RIFCSPLOWO2_01_FULL_38_21]